MHRPPLFFGGPGCWVPQHYSGRQPSGALKLSGEAGSKNGVRSSLQREKRVAKGGGGGGGKEVRGM